MPAASDINKTRDGTRETGFPEPLSVERNTTLPHEDAQTAPHEELDMAAISGKRRHHHHHHHHHHHRPHMRHHNRAEAEMYSGLEVQENTDDGRPREGVVKRVLGKLSCRT